VAAVTRRATPDVLGYLAAVAMSVVVADLGLVAVQLAGEPVEALVVWGPVALLLGLAYVAVPALVVAPLGVLAVHLACRRVTAQWVHVAAAGLAGAVAGVAVQPLMAGVDGLERAPWLVLVLAVAAATGRLAAVPMRPHVAVPTEPVDDDSRPGAPAR
jgi:hypothetical protein